MDKEQLRPIVEAARAGSTDAFAELYTAFHQSLYKTAYYLLGDPYEAEDVVMETVTDAFLGIAKLRAADAFEGWLYKILYNKARRRRGVLISRAAGELHEGIEAENGTSEQIAASVDLLRALDQLKSEERAIVVLAVCDGYSSQEIAKIMRLNANTVRSKQMRALAKLRAILQEGEGE